jgi:hypothetical protein
MIDNVREYYQNNIYSLSKISKAMEMARGQLKYRE